MYSIAILKGGPVKRNRVEAVLSDKLSKDGRFRANLLMMEVKSTRQDRVLLGAKVYTLPAILVERVRLTTAKPYCGNHPGECVVNPFTGPTKKPNSTFLEWDDWVAFHRLVNGVLNRLRVRANVWSLPPDAKGKMWIRRGRFARVVYEWEQQSNGLRVWDTGSPGQFATVPFTFKM